MSNQKKFKYACVVIPATVVNGIVGGVSSVITAYFFKPIWNKITKLWEKTDERKID